jgi:hypothetical protein
MRTTIYIAKEVVQKSYNLYIVMNYIYIGENKYKTGQDP